MLHSSGVLRLREMEVRAPLSRLWSAQSILGIKLAIIFFTETVSSSSERW
jgi:hypothetical protein